MLDTLGLGDAVSKGDAVAATDTEACVALPDEDGHAVDEALLQGDADTE